MVDYWVVESEDGGTRYMMARVPRYNTNAPPRYVTAILPQEVYNSLTLWGEYYMVRPEWPFIHRAFGSRYIPPPEVGRLLHTYYLGMFRLALLRCTSLIRYLTSVRPLASLLPSLCRLSHGSGTVIHGFPRGNK